MDPRPLLLLAVMFMLLNGAVLGLMHARLPSDVQSSAVDWRIGTLLVAGGVVLLAVQDLGPISLLLPVGNGLFFTAIWLYWRAMTRFQGMPPPPRWSLLLIVVGVAAVWFFSAIQPSVNARVVLASPLLAFYFFAAAWTARQGQTELRTSLSLIAGVFAFDGAFLLFRAGYFGLALVQADSIVTAGVTINVVSSFLIAILPVIGTTAFLVACSERARHQAEVAATTDELTGLPNRRQITAIGQARFKLAATSGKPSQLAIAVIDVDFFKSINDRFGHDGGDVALKHVAEVLRTHCPAPGLIGRQGGEEFVAVLAINHASEALTMAEQLRGGIESSPVNINGAPLRITASIGVAIMHAADADHSALLQRADRALYAAKSVGRNRVVVDPVGAPPEHQTASLPTARSTS